MIILVILCFGWRVAVTEKKRTPSLCSCKRRGAGGKGKHDTQDTSLLFHSSVRLLITVCGGRRMLLCLFFVWRVKSEARLPAILNSGDVSVLDTRLVLWSLLVSLFFGGSFLELLISLLSVSRTCGPCAVKHIGKTRHSVHNSIQ